MAPSAEAEAGVGVPALGAEVGEALSRAVKVGGGMGVLKADLVGYGGGVGTVRNGGCG